MSAAKKVTNAILTDIEDAQRYNYTSVPDLRLTKTRRPGLINALLQRYYIETCLYAVEKWELHVTNVVSIAVFFFIAKSLYTLALLVAESFGLSQ